MDWLTAIIIVLIVLIICIYVVGYLHENGTIPSDPVRDTIANIKRSVNRKYDEYVTTPEDLYAATVGHVRDDIADMAIEKIAKKELMNKRNEDSGTLSDKNLLDASRNAYMLAELTRFNIMPNEAPENRAVLEQDTAEYYRRAIERIGRNPVVVVEGTNDENVNMPRPETIVLRAEDFYEDAIARHVMQPEQVPNFNIVRNNLTDARIKKAADKVKKNRNNDIPEKQQIQNEYYDERIIANDPQNVHDAQANKDFSNKYSRILEKNALDLREAGKEKEPTDKVIEKISKYIGKHKFGKKGQKERALKAFNKIIEGNHVSAVNASDREIMANVWRRINSPENKDKKTNLKSALMDSLVECVEPSGYGGDYLICAHGRGQHIVDTLTMLDSDDKLSKSVRTGETLRNEVFMKSHKIIMDELKEAGHDVAKAYNGMLDEPRDDIKNDVAALEQKMKDKIDETLRNDYKDVDPKILNGLINEAQAGV